MHARTSPNGLFSRLTIRRSPLPQTVARASELLEAASSPSVWDVTSLLSHDPLASLSVLKRANHAYYGYRGSVDSLTHAVELLGPASATRFVAQLGREQHGVPPADVLQTLSAHARETGRIAHFLATGLWLFETDGQYARSSEVPGQVFTTALLHSVGRLILASSFPEQAQSLYGKTDKPGMFVSGDWSLAERLQFGADHAEVAEYACQKLRLPESTTAVIRLAGRSFDTAVPDPQTQSQAATIQLSARLASAAGYGAAGIVSYLEILQPSFWEPYLSAQLVSPGQIEHLQDHLNPRNYRPGRLADDRAASHRNDITSSHRRTSENDQAADTNS